MAAIRKEIELNARADRVWDAMRDFGAVHERVAPGFVIRTELEPDARIVHFSNGTSARELLVTLDDENRRLVYAAQSERIKHHNASVQIFSDGDNRSRLVWQTDVLPDDIAPYIDTQMDLAVTVMKPALERA